MCQLILLYYRVQYSVLPRSRPVILPLPSLHVCSCPFVDHSRNDDTHESLSQCLLPPPPQSGQARLFLHEAELLLYPLIFFNAGPVVVTGRVC